MVKKPSVLDSKYMQIAPKKFMKWAINKTLKKLEDPNVEVKNLFSTAMGRGLVLSIANVGSYHFICDFSSGKPEFSWLRDNPLKPFPRKINRNAPEAIEELKRITAEGMYANCEVIMPYKIFLLIIANEMHPADAGKKGVLEMIDYDGWGSNYHSTFMLKFYVAMGDAVELY